MRRNYLFANNLYFTGSWIRRRYKKFQEAQRSSMCYNYKELLFGQHYEFVRVCVYMCEGACVCIFVFVARARIRVCVYGVLYMQGARENSLILKTTYAENDILILKTIYRKLFFVITHSYRPWKSNLEQNMVSLYSYLYLYIFCALLDLQTIYN